MRNVGLRRESFSKCRPFWQMRATIQSRIADVAGSNGRSAGSVDRIEPICKFGKSFTRKINLFMRPSRILCESPHKTLSGMEVPEITSIDDRASIDGRGVWATGRIPSSGPSQQGPSKQYKSLHPGLFSLDRRLDLTRHTYAHHPPLPHCNLRKSSNIQASNTRNTRRLTGWRDRQWQ